MFYNICELVAVAALWGITNPFLRLGSAGIDSLQDTGSTFRNFLQELRLIGRRLNYWVPFLLNQCGSLLYIWVLRNGRIVTAVPVVNSLTFVFTALTGYCLGEGVPKKDVIISTILIAIGTSLILYDQQTLNEV